MISCNCALTTTDTTEQIKISIPLWFLNLSKGAYLQIEQLEIFNKALMAFSSKHSSHIFYSPYDFKFDTIAHVLMDMP